MPVLGSSWRVSERPLAGCDSGHSKPGSVYGRKLLIAVLSAPTEISSPSAIAIPAFTSTEPLCPWHALRSRVLWVAELPLPVGGDAHWRYEIRGYYYQLFLQSPVIARRNQRTVSATLLFVLCFIALALLLLRVYKAKKWNSI